MDEGGGMKDEMPILQRISSFILDGRCSQAGNLSIAARSAQPLMNYQIYFPILLNRRFIL